MNAFLASIMRSIPYLRADVGWDEISASEQVFLRCSKCVSDVRLIDFVMPLRN